MIVGIDQKGKPMFLSRNHKPFNKHGLIVRVDDVFQMLSISIGDISETLSNADIRALRNVAAGVDEIAHTRFELFMFSRSDNPNTLVITDVRQQYMEAVTLESEDFAAITNLCNLALANKRVSFSDYENDV